MESTSISVRDDRRAVAVIPLINEKYQKKN